MSISRRQFGLSVAASSLPALLAGGCMSKSGPDSIDEDETFVFRPLPPLSGEGWINGGPPSEEQLIDKVLVIDCFASWCGPCAIAAPSLVNLYLKYRYNGVRFIGLTTEPESKLDAIMRFVEQNNTSWPIAYGAVQTMLLLEVDAIPRVFVVGRDGMIRWDSQQSGGSLERAIRDGLAQPSILNKTETPEEPVTSKTPLQQPAEGENK